MHAVEQDHKYKSWSKTGPEQENSIRRQVERRQRESKGYTYISIVGWIDRREKGRRDDDESDLW